MRGCFAWLCLALLLGGGCKDSNSKQGTAASVDPELAEKQDDLIARRDALLQARKEVTTEKERIKAERDKIAQEGGDTSEYDKKVSELEAKSRKLDQEESALGKAEDDMLKAALISAGKAQNTAAREALVAQREREFARRESRIAEREAQMAAREKALGLREKEMCSGGQATTTTIVQTIDAKGSKYNKKDVEPMLKRARRDMNKKGILYSDLPAPVQGLESEATKAMGKGDYGRAHFAATQLVQSVRSLKVNKSFIAAKISRLDRKIKGKKLSSTQQKEVESLFRKATASFGDGNYSSANRNLNRIYAAVR
jgi:hypothetical protein